jgi:hypothetical protein
MIKNNFLLILLMLLQFTAGMIYGMVALFPNMELIIIISVIVGCFGAYLLTLGINRGWFL